MKLIEYLRKNGIKIILYSALTALLSWLAWVVTDESPLRFWFLLFVFALVILLAFITKISTGKFFWELKRSDLESL